MAQRDSGERFLNRPDDFLATPTLRAARRVTQRPTAAAKSSGSRRSASARAARCAVSGERITWQNSVEKSTPFLLRHERGRWTEQAFEDVGELVTAASGERWMFGAAAWQEQQGTWRKVPLRADLREASEVRVRAPDDIWWLGATDVWHFDGEHTRRVALQRPDERSSVMRVALAGPNLYVSSQFKVWQLVAPARPASNVITLHLGRAPAEFR